MLFNNIRCSVEERTEWIECGKAMITTLRDNYSSEIVIFIYEHLVNNKIDNSAVIVDVSVK